MLATKCLFWQIKNAGFGCLLAGSTKGPVVKIAKDWMISQNE